ncbi:MAG: class I SAM-dependent methyltransferase, partial [Comamonas sp.]
MKSASDSWFDEAYYERYYFDKKTSVVDPQHMERLGSFVCSYLKYLRVPVRRVLDVGCGIGLWRDIIARHFPQATFHGVEYSAYLCERFGWERGSVVDYRAEEPFDFVICQGVLPYLSAADLKRAPGTQRQAVPGARGTARRALCRLPAASQPLPVCTAPDPGHAGGRVPADGRYRTAQAQQHRLAG